MPDNAINLALSIRSAAKDTTHFKNVVDVITIDDAGAGKSTEHESGVLILLKNGDTYRVSVVSETT